MTFLSDRALKDKLNNKGYRSTSQRQKVLRIFMSLPQGEHLSAEELHETLVRDGNRISLSTVYRTLHLMVSIGLVRELELAEGHKHYELSRPSRDHHHLVCLSCNQTIEFSESSVTELGEKTAKNAGYQVLDCQLTLYGICTSCATHRSA